MNDSFWDALGQLAPFAVAESLSYTPVAAVMVLLLGDRGRRAALIFLYGWLGALTLVATAFVAGGTALLPRFALRGLLVALLELAAGLALAVFGVVTWTRRAVSSGTAEKLLDRIDSASGPALLVAGLLLGIGPKSLFLGLSAGLVVREAGLPLAEVVLCVVAYVALAGWTVALPVVATFVAPRTARRALRAVERWMTHHSSLIAAVVLVVLGGVVVVDAVGRF